MSGLDFHHPGVGSQSLGVRKINAVLALVLGAFIRVVFKYHGVSRPIVRYN